MTIDRVIRRSIGVEGNSIAARVRLNSKRRSRDRELGFGAGEVGLRSRQQHELVGSAPASDGSCEPRSMCPCSIDGAGSAAGQQQHGSAHPGIDSQAEALADAQSAVPISRNARRNRDVGQGVLDMGEFLSDQDETIIFSNSTDRRTPWQAQSATNTTPFVKRQRSGTSKVVP